MKSLFAALAVFTLVSISAKEIRCNSDDGMVGAILKTKRNGKFKNLKVLGSGANFTLGFRTDRSGQNIVKSIKVGGPFAREIEKGLKEQIMGARGTLDADGVLVVESSEGREEVVLYCAL